MDLRAVTVEGFRGLHALHVDLSPLTVLLGESRVGKTTFLDALERCLGIARRADAPPFVDDDFVKDEAGAYTPIEVTLHFAGEPADAVLRELTFPLKGEPSLVVQVRATEPQAATWSVLGADGSVLLAPAPASVCARLRALHPVLHLDVDRYGNGAPLLTGAEDTGDEINFMFRRLFGKRGRLTPAELSDGLELLRVAIKPDKEILAPKPRATARLREIVDAPGRLRAFPDQVVESMHSAGSQSLALLLLVAFLLEVREGIALEEGATPILLIEQPELRLHPTVASSLWGILELLPGQKVLTTNSPVLLSSVPLSALRRLTRHGQEVRVHRLLKKTLDFEDLRRIAFHLRLQQSVSLFSRAWLLVEGESEVWLLSELARTCGYVLAAEGVAVLTFAQCGLEPILRLAADLGIDWVVLTDGDEAGLRYAAIAERYAKGQPLDDHLVELPAQDIEHFMWESGYADVYRRAAGDLVPKKQRRRKKRYDKRGFQTHKVIRRAIRGSSKPGLALRVAVAASRRDGPGVPPLLRATLDAAVRLAREAADGVYQPDAESQ
jgi:putative ATP-dependent endonuclease of OLD family